MRRLKLKGNGVIVIVLILMVFIFMGCQRPMIEDLKGPDWEKYVGKSVTVEAIFVRDPLPMLVTDLNIVLVNTPMPANQYIILTGKEAENIDQKKYGGAKLSLSGIVKAVEDTIKYKGENVTISEAFYEVIERPLEYYHPGEWAADTMVRWFLPYRYAVLFSGGINEVNNHIRYWNDLKFMYSTLINKYGYTDSGIYVLYANGVGRDNQMTVDYSATQANLETVFNELRTKTTSKDFIFMFTTNHGGGFKAKDLAHPDHGGQVDADRDEGEEPIYESTYNMDLNGDGDQNDQVAWDEVLYSWGGDILDDNFPEIFKNLKYNKMVIVMEQCYSGGPIFDMAQSGNNKIIMSAAGQYESSWSMGSGNYDEFSYYFTCAINGATPGGNTVNADANGDGKVSMVEAFNYARTHDTRAETPWYEDNGDGIPHSAEMPALGEGTLGSNTFLK